MTAKPKAKVRGRGKGGANERLVCRQLSEWWTGQKKPVVFWRSGGSGSVQTVSKDSPAMAGDVMATHPDGYGLIDRFLIELKCGRQCRTLDQLMYGSEKSPLFRWWVKARMEADAVGRGPMLIVSPQGRQAYVVMLTMAWLGLDPAKTIDWRPFLTTVLAQDYVAAFPFATLLENPQLRADIERP